ncbi:MAG TPA: nitroreductase family protein [Victivallales bacterium]|nr:nitroreductase family protein [Victivallales bacterium]
MEFYDVIKKRRSVRSYSGKAIPKDALDRIGEAVRLAPSACNIQPWTFRVVFDVAARSRISKVYNRAWLAEAPAVVLAIGNREEAWKRLEGNSIIDIDIAIAMEHFVLAAAAEGLGSCWICAYDVSLMNKAAGVVTPWSVLAISPLGYPADDKPAPKKKNLDKVFKIV